MRGISWLTEDLLASQEGFSTMELVFSPMAQHTPPPLVGQGILITEASRSH